MSGRSMKLILILPLITAVVLLTVAQKCIEECDGCEKKVIGDTWEGRSDGCYQVTCKKEARDKYSKNITECDISWTGFGCTWTAGNLKDPYPSCCPKLNCKQVCPAECPGCDEKSDGDAWEGNHSKGCYKVTCRKRGQLTSWSAEGCSFDVSPYCYALDGDTGAPYPGCCPQIACA